MSRVLSVFHVYLNTKNEILEINAREIFIVLRFSVKFSREGRGKIKGRSPFKRIL